MSYLSDLLGDGYREGMTEDEISSALEGIGNANNAEITKLKTALSKANSEAANFKKELRARQSDEEAQASSTKEMMDNLTKENAELKRSIALSEKTTKLLAMGYDEKLAIDTATAMVDGDMDKVMANQTKYLDAKTKDIRANHMKNTPRPASGASEGGTDYEKLISNARAEGNLSAVAYYTRLMQQDDLSQTE